MQKASTRHRNSHSEYDFLADLEKIKSAFADTAHGVKGKASDLLTHSIDDLKEKTTTAQTSVENFIQDKPLKSVGVALLAGFLIGKFLLK